MKRLTDYGYCAAIEAAMAWLPPPVRALLGHVDFFCGADPIYAGVLNPGPSGEALQGRSYQDTACCGYPEHVLDRRTTVFLPAEDDKQPWVVTHELAHALDERLGFRHDPVHAVIPYAKHNRYERFACWFSEWAWGGMFLTDREGYGRLVLADERMVAAMRRILAGEIP